MEFLFCCGIVMSRVMLKKIVFWIFVFKFCFNLQMTFEIFSNSVYVHFVIFESIYLNSSKIF